MMDMTKDMVEAMKLPPKLAIAYFRSKGYVMPNENTLLSDSRSRAFTIAEATKVDTVLAYQKELDRALSEGLTQDQFIKNIKGKGYSEIDDVPAYRMQTIFRSNMRSALNEGRRIAQVATKDTQPYWMRVAVMDAHTREGCARLNGVIYPADDAFWDDNYPPYLDGEFQFGCRDRVRTLSEKRLKAMQEKNPTIVVSKSDEDHVSISTINSGSYLNDVEVAKKLTRIENEQLREQTIQSLNNSKLRQQQYANWAQGSIDKGKKLGNSFQTVGFVDEDTRKWLANNAGVKQIDPVIAVSEKRIGHMKSDKHVSQSIEPTDQDLLSLPQLIAKPTEVWFVQEPKSLVYFGDTRADGKTLMFIVEDMGLQKEFSKDFKPNTSSRTTTAYYVDKDGRMAAQKGKRIK